MLPACTGLALGENQPDGNLGADLESGTIAVDPRTETSFVLVREIDPQGAENTKRIVAVRPDSGGARTVADVTEHDDPRMLFVSSGVMVMSEVGGGEELRILDQDSFAEQKRSTVDARYQGTRLSASRRWVGVADNGAADAPIHIIDAETLQIYPIPHGGDGFEAMFANKSDRLFAIVFDDDGHDARVLSWPMTALETAGFEPTDGRGTWPGADLDVAVPEVVMDLNFSFTWVGISPDDAKVVIPVRKWTGLQPWESAPAQDYQLLVVDTATGEVRTVESAKGPVGFTPDGSSIVSYRDTGADDMDARLLLIDGATLEVDEEEVSIANGLSYFVSHEGNLVVVASNTGSDHLVLYDVDAHEHTEMAGPGIGLGEFVSRIGHDELWAIDGDGLYRIDMMGAVVEPIDLPFSLGHVGILPRRDRLVLATEDGTGLKFWDPVARKVTRSVDLLAQ